MSDVHPGAYFANAYNTREQVNRDLHEAWAASPRSWAPASGPERDRRLPGRGNQKYLAEKEGIRVCQGNIWSQYAIDNQDGEGSICYPYYPSTEHFCKPAQNAGDFIDCVNLDGWTCDFLAARRQGQDWATSQRSRMGVGPIETIQWFGPEVGLAQMSKRRRPLRCGLRLNGWAWVTNCWEISLVPYIGHLEVLTRWDASVSASAGPSAECLTLGDFGAPSGPIPG